MAARKDASDEALNRAAMMLRETRPTAVNLVWALKRMWNKLLPLHHRDRADAAWREAHAIADEDVALNEGIGRHGLALIRKEFEAREEPINILTHCNAGWIATVDWGTVTAPIFMAHDAGIPVHVWVDETRPRNQGLLTVWELAGHGVPHTLIADNAGGHLMQHGAVDMVMVGADRVTRRGDVCNKIGTYLKALAARDNAVPFVAAVPSPTIDWTLATGADIPIETRSADEVLQVQGSDAEGQPVSVALAPPGTMAVNYAFDVTPARLVTGYLTERGLARSPAALAAQFAGQSGVRP
jgi:methylthioribose-1-phosphate isomerase